MKERILIILLAVFCFLSSGTINVEAYGGPVGHLTNSQLKLAGIAATDTRAFVESVYGKPTRISNQKLVYIYGDSLRVKFFRPENDSQIWDIEIIADNGLATADGVKVGMKVEVMKQKYGNPDRTTQGTKGIIYTYHGAGKDALKTLSFYVRDGVIRSIALHWAD